MRYVFVRYVNGGFMPEGDEQWCVLKLKLPKRILGYVSPMLEGRVVAGAPPDNSQQTKKNARIMKRGDREYTNGHPVAINFRYYDTWEDVVKDHMSEIL